MLRNHVLLILISSIHVSNSYPTDQILFSANDNFEPNEPRHKNFDMLNYQFPDSSFKSSLSGNTPPCNFCIDAVLHIRYGLDNNVTRNVIEYGLKQFCNYLMFPPIIHVCKKQVHVLYQSILDVLDTGVKDPEKVCEILKFCPADPKIGMDLDLFNRL